MNFTEPGTKDNEIWEKCWGQATYSVPLTPAQLQGTVQCCLYDGDPLEEGKEPIRVPVRRSNGKIQYCGVCCSFACAIAFMEDNPRYFTHRSRDLLAEITKEMFSINQPLVKARPIFALQKYGGYLTIQQFRSYGPQHYSALRMPPFEPQELRVIDTVPQGEIRTTKSREQFLRELQEANEELKAKKKRHSEKLYQNSLECLMTKRPKQAPEVPANFEPFALPPASNAPSPKPDSPAAAALRANAKVKFAQPSTPKSVPLAPKPAAKPKAARKGKESGNYFSAFRPGKNPS